MFDEKSLFLIERKVRSGAIKRINLSLRYKMYVVDIRHYDDGDIITSTVKFDCTDGVGPVVEIFSPDCKNGEGIRYKLNPITPALSPEDVDKFTEDLRVCNEFALFLQENFQRILDGDIKTAN